ncbi:MULTISPECIES: photosystem I reaction center subunit IX [unclassified Leptolyngbya]|nr:MULTISPECIES: photosystem I reaction center subunit IX [unclassified Leptolyngbya]MBD1912280.1 photosystem I reaction center subunit IX [Leptolyngbya sp. FACHB-8]MBD2153849.1 photosystem I reaction center subunit IX [Leptolyngbya sp. FACHB-16]
MQYFVKYLSTAPVLATVTVVVLASLLIEINRLFPDLLFAPIP